MSKNTDHQLAVTRIFMGYSNGTNSEQALHSNISFKVESHEVLEAIREKSQKELKKSHQDFMKKNHYKDIDISFMISTNPEDIKNARNKHPNKIFHP